MSPKNRCILCQEPVEDNDKDVCKGCEAELNAYGDEELKELDFSITRSEQLADGFRILRGEE